ncbi:hypothetical protein ABT324_00455 [Saccharopolyspora sp. NPDC000359]|uniref:hypothetical protein n=1 Tax=Saccharopolyspora sp. NPDC000359 TaxID=3154251 RepID=UPI003327791E
MALPTRQNGWVVDAADDWNPLINQVNTNTSGIAANTASIGALEARTTNASTGNTALGGRVQTLETAAGNLDGRVYALERKPWIILKKNAVQQIASGGTDKVVTWQVVDGGQPSMKNGDAIQIPAPGNYLLTANVNMQGGGSTIGDTVVYIVKNSTTDVFNSSLAAFSQPGTLSTGGVGNGLSTSVVANLATNDLIRVLVWQGSGSDRPLRPNDFGGCTFTVTRL